MTSCNTSTLLISRPATPFLCSLRSFRSSARLNSTTARSKTLSDSIWPALLISASAELSDLQIYHQKKNKSLMSIR